MMITIHGFPAKTKYQDVKMLIKQECSLNVFVLDNLVNDSDGTKKVRIGLTDNTEGYNVMKCLDGYRMAGNFVLKAIPIGKAVQGHPQPSFNQSRADQGYGYTPKSNVPEVVPANSRYRWVRKAEQEPTVSKPPDYGEDSASPAFADDIFDEKLQDIPNESDKDPSNIVDEKSQDIPNESEKDPSNIFDEKSQDIPNESEKDPSNILDKKSQDIPNESENPSNELLPPETTLSKKARKRQQAKLRDMSKLNGAKRRRLYFWLKQGKSFMEARELCEIGVKHIPEYPALKAEMKKKAREVALRRMSPERQAWAIKLDRLKGRGVPGAPAEPRPRCQPIRVRFVDELGLMSQEKIEMLQDKILELIDAETDANGPGFVGCATPYGNLLLSCVDAQTLEWLENHLPSFQLWEGAQLKIINLSESKPAIGIAYVPDPNLDPHAILNMLKSQNQGFDFSDWWITSMKPNPPAGQIVSFNIDNSSVEKLAERNNFLYLGVKKLKIRIKNYKAKAPPGMLPVRQEAKGKMDKPPKGQRGMQPMDQMSVPPKGQRGMQPKGQRGMQPKSQRGMQPMHQISMLPKGQRGMQPKSQRGMQPMHQMSMLPKGQRGMQPKGQRRMQPMDQMGMLPMGQRGMQPMYQMGMSPMNMGQMRPMDMGYMGQVDTGYMGQMDTGYMGQMDTGYMGQMGYVSTGSYYSPDFSQPGYFGGGNQPKHYGGGKNHNNRQIQGGPHNNAGHMPKSGKRNKKNK